MKVKIEERRFMKKKIKSLCDHAQLVQLLCHGHAVRDDDAEIKIKKKEDDKFEF